MSTEHVARTVKGDHIPGTWRSVCSCGWLGMLRGSPGARAAAVAERHAHVEDEGR